VDVRRCGGVLGFGSICGWASLTLCLQGVMALITKMVPLANRNGYPFWIPVSGWAAHPALVSVSLMFLFLSPKVSHAGRTHPDKQL
jgi:hypothetical protein